MTSRRSALRSTPVLYALHEPENGLLPAVFTASEWVKIRRVTGIPNRQLEVAQWICRGCNNEEIAARIGIRADTARMHTRNLYRSLGVRKRIGVPIMLLAVVQNG